MFIVVDDVFGIFVFFWRSFLDDDYFEEVLIRFGCEVFLEFLFMDEDGVKKVCVFFICVIFYDWEMF